MPAPHRRLMEHFFKIRSYVRREGKITKAQRQALTELLPRYAILAGEDILDLPQVFGNDNPISIEIGFGNGDSLLAMAQQQTAVNFIGIEVHRPGVGRLLQNVAREDLNNIKIAVTDASEFIAHRLANASVEKVMIFFPDPWHKRKHHKRRIIKHDFILQLIRILKPGGILHIATDWQDYADEIIKVTDAFVELVSANYPVDRPRTKFEQRGENLGHTVTDIVLTLVTT